MRLYSCSLFLASVNTLYEKHHRSLSNQMLRACLHTSLLHTQDRLVCGFSGQKWIGAKPFPVPATLRDTTHIHHWPKSNVDAFPDKLATHVEPAKADEVSIPTTKDQWEITGEGQVRTSQRY